MYRILNQASQSLERGSKRNYGSKYLSYRTEKPIINALARVRSFWHIGLELQFNFLRLLNYRSFDSIIIVVVVAVFIVFFFSPWHTFCFSYQHLNYLFIYFSLLKIFGRRLVYTLCIIYRLLHFDGSVGVKSSNPWCTIIIRRVKSD